MSNINKVIALALASSKLAETRLKWILVCFEWSLSSYIQIGMISLNLVLIEMHSEYAFLGVDISVLHYINGQKCVDAGGKKKNQGFCFSC